MNITIADRKQRRRLFNKSRRKMAKLHKKERESREQRVQLKLDTWDTHRNMSLVASARLVREAKMRVGGKGTGRVRKWKTER